MNIGLAEYTNANFASRDTIFTENNLSDLTPFNDKHYFPFPRRSDTIVVAESQNQTWNGFQVFRKYFEKIGGEHVKHFAVASRLYTYLQDDPSPVLQGFDDKCHADYAEKLIPRAVGYSASLLDYFFRGEIDLMADPAEAGWYKILNLTDERMTGTFSLYRDDAAGNRSLLWSKELDIAPQGEAREQITPALAAAEWGSHLLVFHGRLGSEEGAVAGRVLRAGWREEWTADLKGTHPWIFTGVDLLYQNPAGAWQQAMVDEGRLVLDSIRPAGSHKAQVNMAYIGKANSQSGGSCYMDGQPLPCDFTREFPLPVTPKTVLSVKIDELGISEPIPEQTCSISLPRAGYQGITFWFTLADGSTKVIQLTVDGHQNGFVLNRTIPLGQDFSVNVHELLQYYGVAAAPVAVEGINIVQQLPNLCAPAATEQAQHMVVDYIRLEER
jgi:hypothetical protein